MFGFSFFKYIISQKIKNGVQRERVFYFFDKL